MTRAAIHVRYSTERHTDRSIEDQSAIAITAPRARATSAHSESTSQRMPFSAGTGRNPYASPSVLSLQRPAGEGRSASSRGGRPETCP
jgi:hypothetical protein